MHMNLNYNLPVFYAIVVPMLYLSHFIQWKSRDKISAISLVLEMGLEPIRTNVHWILSPTCLPIPPLELAYQKVWRFCHRQNVDISERKTGFEYCHQWISTLTFRRAESSMARDQGRIPFVPITVTHYKNKSEKRDSNTNTNGSAPWHSAGRNRQWPATKVVFHLYQLPSLTIKTRAKNGIRTRDPHLGKVMLYPWATFAFYNFNLKRTNNNFYCGCKFNTIL